MKIELCLKDYGIVFIDHENKLANNMRYFLHENQKYAKVNYEFYQDYKHEFDSLVIYED